MITTNKRLSKKDRDELRRAEIIAAARKCVAYKGFHATSMAQISKNARMSVGHIYRYFENKEAIIKSIVEQITVEQLNWIANTAYDENIADFQIKRYTELYVINHEMRALLLEIHAEAARNPEIASILQHSDKKCHEMAVSTVSKIFPEFEATDINARVELMATISESFLMRSLKETESDKEKVTELLHKLIKQLWSKE